jgi:hypothetical protein
LTGTRPMAGCGSGGKELTGTGPMAGCGSGGTGKELGAPSSVIWRSMLIHVSIVQKHGATRDTKPRAARERFLFSGYATGRPRHTSSDQHRDTRRRSAAAEANVVARYTSKERSGVGNFVG